MLEQLSNEELDVIAATDVMGWEDGAKIGASHPNCWYPPAHDPIPKLGFTPTRDRNQSKQVRNAAYEKTEAPLDPSFDPREETIAAIRAMREGETNDPD